MNRMILLPDRNGREKWPDTTGLVRYGADTEVLAELPERMVMRPEAAASEGDAAWRGALALALLADSWDEALQLTLTEVDAATSAFASWVMASRSPLTRHEPLTLLTICREESSCLLGLLDRSRGLRLAAQMDDLSALLPERVTWYDRQTRSFLDPVPLLSERDRDLLLRRLNRLDWSDPAVDAFRRALGQAEAGQRQAYQEGRSEALARLTLRAQAALGMGEVPGFSTRKEGYRAASENPVMNCFGAENVQVDAKLAESILLLWQGQPFGRASTVTGWTDTRAPGEQETLAVVEREITLMSENLTSWSRDTALALGQWLQERTGDAALLPMVREHLTLLQGHLEELGRGVQGPITLRFPWDERSGAVQTILREALGESWMRGASQPFSDRLTCVTTHTLGDMALRSCCMVEAACLLPPLSRTMAECVAAAEKGQGLALDAFQYQILEDGSVTASFLLRGAGEIRLERTYAPEMQLYLEDVPTVAVYPCVPLEGWKDFKVLVRGGDVTVSALEGGQWQPCDPAESWSVLSVTELPACLTLEKDGESLGALPNLLPNEKTPAPADAVAAIDLGTSSVAVSLTLDGRDTPVEHRPLLRMLLLDTSAPMDDLLASLTASQITMASVMLPGEGDVPLRDGYVYRPTASASLTEKKDAPLLSALKWRADAAGLRARKLLLHQVMWETALCASLQGARTLNWRTAVEDDMEDAGRAAILAEVEEAARNVSVASSLLPRGELLTWTAESAALSAYLRGEAGIPGSFAAVDLGAGSLRMSLWLRSFTRASCGVSLPHGTHEALLEVYQRDPECLAYDFSDCANAGLQASASALYDLLVTQKQAARASLLLDTMLAEYATPLAMHMNGRVNGAQPTFLQSVMIEILAGALFNAGLMVAMVKQDSMTNHHLPQQLPVVLTGRGSLMMSLLPPGVMTGLGHFVSVATDREYGIGQVSVQLVREPKMAIARGLQAIKTLTAPESCGEITTTRSFSEMMLLLMRTLCMVAPSHMALLHSGLADVTGHLTQPGIDTVRRAASAAYGTGHLTQPGIDTVRRAASAAYGTGEDIPGAVMLFLQIMRAEAIQADELTPPGG